MVDDPAPGTDSLLGTARARVAKLGAWRRDLTHELAQLPDTMRSFRNGAAKFELVGERLAKSSASLEGISELYEATIADSGRKSAQALDALKTQIESLSQASTSPERVASSVNEIRQALDGFAELNPFWPGSGRKR